MATKLMYGFMFERFANSKDPVRVGIREHTNKTDIEDHRHDFIQLWYCAEGEYTHKIYGQNFRCEKGSMVIVPAGCLHDVFFDVPTRVLCLDVSYDFLLQKVPNNYKNAVANLFLGDFASEVSPDFSCYRMLSPASQNRVEEIFAWFVLLSYEAHSVTDYCRFWEKLEELFSLPEFAMTKPQQEKALHIIQSRVIPIFKMVAFLNDHYGEKITEGQLLEGANISRAVMYRYFKRILGETYAIYLQKLRVRRAHIYMRTTTLHITQIAQICGFYDVCYLTKVYTKYWGTTPSQQRQFMRQIYGGCYKPQSAK